MPIRLRVGDLARQQGLTIKALAARAGIAYNTAHSLVTGRATRIDLDTLDRIATALDVEPGSLFVRTRTAERSYRDADTTAPPDGPPMDDSDRAARASAHAPDDAHEAGGTAGGDGMSAATATDGTSGSAGARSGSAYRTR